MNKNKKGNVILYVIFSFIALVLFMLLTFVIPDVYDDLRIEVDYVSSNSFAVKTISNTTLYPIGEGIRETTVTRKNGT